MVWLFGLMLIILCCRYLYRDKESGRVVADDSETKQTNCQLISNWHNAPLPYDVRVVSTDAIGNKAVCATIVLRQQLSGENVFFEAAVSPSELGATFRF